MLLVPDVLLVEIVHVHLLLAVRCLEQLEEIAFELVAVVVDEFLWVLANQEHRAYVAFGHGVLFEAVLVPTLFLADLTIPSQSLKTFGFHLVGDVFGRTDLCFRHDGGGEMEDCALWPRRRVNVVTLLNELEVDKHICTQPSSYLMQQFLAYVMIQVLSIAASTSINTSLHGASFQHAQHSHYLGHD
nr:hypothetical protein CFP56_71080 [Quercus suber]